MKVEYFNEAEAKGLVGHRVETTTAIAKIPSGTKGKITEAHQHSADAWKLSVEFQRAGSQYFALLSEFSINFTRRGKPVVIEITKDQFIASVKPIAQEK